MDEIIRKLKDARTLVNDGNNERGCYLTGERCKAIVRWIDEAMLYIIQQEKKKDDE